VGEIITELKDLLEEIGYGEVKFKISGGRILVAPRQMIERPSKAGIRTLVYIDEPITLRQS